MINSYRPHNHKEILMIFNIYISPKLSRYCHKNNFLWNLTSNVWYFYVKFSSISFWHISQNIWRAPVPISVECSSRTRESFSLRSRTSSWIAAYSSSFLWSSSRSWRFARSRLSNESTLIAGNQNQKQVSARSTRRHGPIALGCHHGGAVEGVQ